MKTHVIHLVDRMADALIARNHHSYDSLAWDRSDVVYEKARVALVSFLDTATFNTVDMYVDVESEGTDGKHRVNIYPNQKKVNAIKLLRQFTGMGLKHCKIVVDNSINDSVAVSLNVTKDQLQQTGY